jgi:CRP/FNR family transcriptional regulator
MRRIELYDTTLRDGSQGEGVHFSLRDKLQIAEMLDELDAAREWMLLLGRKSAQEKVASLLLLVARRVPNIGCQHTPSMNFSRFALPLTRADVADHLGLTLETVSRQISRLKTRGVIELAENREIVVPDLGVLAAAAGE